MVMEKAFVRKQCNRCITCFLRPTFTVLRLFGLSGVVPTDRPCEALASTSTKPRIRWRDFLSTAVLWIIFVYLVVVCVIIQLDKEKDEDKMADDMALVIIISHIIGKKYLLLSMIVTSICYFQGAINITLINFSPNRGAVTDKLCKLWKESNRDLYADTGSKNGKWRFLLIQRIVLYGSLLLQLVTIILFFVYFFNYTNFEKWPELSVPQTALVLVAFVLCPFQIVLILTLCFVYFVSVCNLMKWRFNAIVDELRQLSERPEAITSIKRVHFKHHKMCKIVEAADKFMCNYIFATYAVSLPSICVVLHFLYSESKDSTLNTVLGLIAVGLVFNVLGVTLSTGSITSLGHRPKEVLHNVSILAVPKEIRLEINIFLERLNGPTVGFTCLDFFVVTNGTLTSIASVVVTYLLMYLQFSQSRKIN